MDCVWRLVMKILVGGGLWDLVNKKFDGLRELRHMQMVKGLPKLITPLKHVCLPTLKEAVYETRYFIKSMQAYVCGPIEQLSLVNWLISSIYWQL